MVGCARTKRVDQGIMDVRRGLSIEGLGAGFLLRPLFGVEDRGFFDVGQTQGLGVASRGVVEHVVGDTGIKDSSPKVTNTNLRGAVGVSF